MQEEDTFPTTFLKSRMPGLTALTVCLLFCQMMLGFTYASICMHGYNAAMFRSVLCDFRQLPQVTDTWFVSIDSLLTFLSKMLLFTHVCMG